MSFTTYKDIEQGSLAWLELRRGMLTASTIGNLITATLKPADNETSRALTRHLVAERITGYTEDTYVSADMERGTLDEPFARAEYEAQHASVTEVAFMVRHLSGHEVGYSPDGLVGDDGLIEIKSRRQKVQLATILNDAVPAENLAQIHTGLVVSGRAWCDYVSYCGGMPLYVKRVFPDANWRGAIYAAVTQFEKRAAEMRAAYDTATRGIPNTKRIEHFAEMSFT